MYWAIFTSKSELSAQKLKFEIFPQKCKISAIATHLLFNFADLGKKCDCHDILDLSSFPESMVHGIVGLVTCREQRQIKIDSF